MGQAIRTRYGNNLYGNNLVAKTFEVCSEDELCTRRRSRDLLSAPTGSHHATLEVKFERPITFDRALTMEWLNAGQHVEKTQSKAFKEGKWTAVARGQAIGHKKIDSFPPVPLRACD